MHVLLAAGYIHLMQTTSEDDLSDILHRDVEILYIRKSDAIDLTHFHTGTAVLKRLFVSGQYSQFNPFSSEGG